MNHPDLPTARSRFAGCSPSTLDNERRYQAAVAAELRSATLSDTDALDLIRDEMSGADWSADTLDVIAAYVRGTGRGISDDPGNASNGTRAARAKDTVAAYVDIVGGGYDLLSGNGISEAISDLLADLRHRCAELGLDYDVLDARAAANYRAEDRS